MASDGCSCVAPSSATASVPVEEVGPCCCARYLLPSSASSSVVELSVAAHIHQLLEQARLEQARRTRF